MEIMSSNNQLRTKILEIGALLSEKIKKAKVNDSKPDDLRCLVWLTVSIHRIHR